MPTGNYMPMTDIGDIDTGDVSWVAGRCLIGDCAIVPRAPLNRALRYLMTKQGQEVPYWELFDYSGYTNPKTSSRKIADTLENSDIFRLEILNKGVILHRRDQ